MRFGLLSGWVGKELRGRLPIRVSNEGKVFVCKATSSQDFGATPGVIGPSLFGNFGTTGDMDGFVASFNATSGATLAKPTLEHLHMIKVT